MTYMPGQKLALALDSRRLFTRLYLPCGSFLSSPVHILRIRKVQILSAGSNRYTLLGKE